MRTLDVVVDLQYGSTGKGLLAGYLSTNGVYDTLVTAWAPNAGHTFIDAGGRKYVHTHLANGVVGKFVRRVMLGPGSLINPDQLLDEIAQCRDHIRDRQIRIMIHPHAAVVLPRHVEEEAGPMTKIGSTKKGVGAAMIQRIRRDPGDMNIAARCEMLTGLVVTKEEYRDAMAAAQHVLVEGAQGYGLSMYHGFYPYTTSRDVSTFQILADSGIPMGQLRRGSDLSVIGTCRTYPIRVANRYDDRGEQVGYSGPYYEDQEEISFESIGQRVELTTVTKLPRRIFTFSEKQIAEACEHNGANEVFLNFVNYARNETELIDVVQKIERGGLAEVKWVGVGPTVADVHEVSGRPRARLDRIVELWEESRNERLF